MHTRVHYTTIQTGIKVHQIACGLAMTLFLVDAAADVSKFPVWEGAQDNDSAEGGDEGASKGTKRKVWGGSSYRISCGALL